ncbi:hypothetical protein J2805_000228 [Arthrobacter oryzae]|nr:hypothetical protein [Arthrobacter oryzae]
MAATHSFESSVVQSKIVATGGRRMFRGRTFSSAWIYRGTEFSPDAPPFSTEDIHRVIHIVGNRALTVILATAGAAADSPARVAGVT